MSACTPERACQLLLALLGAAAACTPHTPPDATSPEGPGQLQRQLSLSGPLTRRRELRLQQLGLRTLGRVGPGRWLLCGPPRAFAALEREPWQLSLRAPSLGRKLSPRLARALARPPAEELRLWVLLTPLVDRDLDLRRDFLRSQRDLQPQRVALAPIYELVLPGGQRWEPPAAQLPPRLRRLARHAAVLQLDLPPGPAVPLLDGSRSVMGLDPLQGPEPLGDPPAYELAGQGMVAGIWDPDGVDPKHDDVSEALLRWPLPQNASSLSHGTAVAGCLAGRGTLSHDPPTHPWAPLAMRGAAPQAKLAMWLTSGDRDFTGKPTSFPEQYLKARTDYGVDVLSFSFSYSWNGFYDTVAANLDFVVAQGNPALPAPVPIAVSAGNDGAQGYGSVSSLSTAKNVITVGASDWVNRRLAGFSSFGPTKDGRIKPEVTAPGCASHGWAPVALHHVRLADDHGRFVEWSFETGHEGWEVYGDIAKHSVSQGAHRGITAGSRPGWIGPADMGLEASGYTRAAITLQLSHHHQAELSWRRQGQGFSSSRRMRFFVLGDGQPHTYELPLDQVKAWSGTVDQLRVRVLASGILLPSPGETYRTTCGTSMSAPLVAGGVLLIKQALRQSLPELGPVSPALIKAMLVSTAEDLVGQGQAENPDLAGAPTPLLPGPDHASGYGDVRIPLAVQLARDAAQGRVGFVQASVPETGRAVGLRLRLSQPSAEPLRVTIAWDDPPGLPGAEQVLQNDLDLTVTTPAGKTLLPWVVDPLAPTAPATTGVDRTNNLEQVQIEAPVAGEYWVRVVGHELPAGAQSFALALSSAAHLAELTLDADGDGVTAEADCDDSDPLVHPGASEQPGNGRDDDCDPGTSDQMSPDAGSHLDAGAGADSAPSSDAAEVQLALGGGGCSLAGRRGARVDEVLWWAPIFGMLAALGIGAQLFGRRRARARRTAHGRPPVVGGRAADGDPGAHLHRQDAGPGRRSGGA